MIDKRGTHYFDESEERLYRAFRTKHILMCNTEPEVIYTNCGIGSAIEVQCPQCGAIENITNYGRW